MFDSFFRRRQKRLDRIRTISLAAHIINKRLNEEYEKDNRNNLPIIDATIISSPTPTHGPDETAK